MFATAPAAGCSRAAPCLRVPVLCSHEELTDGHEMKWATRMVRVLRLQLLKPLVAMLERWLLC